MTYVGEVSEHQSIFDTFRLCNCEFGHSVVQVTESRNMTPVTPNGIIQATIPLWRVSTVLFILVIFSIALSTWQMSNTNIRGNSSGPQTIAFSQSPNTPYDKSITDVDELGFSPAMRLDREVHYRYRSQVG